MIQKTIGQSLLLLCWLMLLSCTSLVDTNSQVKVDPERQFDQLLSDFKQDPLAVSYQHLWQVYLQTNQVHQTALSQSEFEQVQQQIQQGLVACETVDWYQLTRKNFWSVMPHKAASDCYQQHNLIPQSEYHDNAIKFITQGMLSSGTGETSYSAYEVPTWGEAEDLVTYLGYQVVDNYLEFQHHRKALYYVVVVNDQQTGKQKSIYFENNRLLHALLKIDFPFAGVNDVLYRGVVEPLAKNLRIAKFAKAQVLAEDDKINEAMALYIEAADQGSPVAAYRLGLLCLQSTQTVLSVNQCTDYVIEGVESGYVNVALLLAYMYKEGVNIHQDDEAYQQLLNYSSQQLPAGHALLLLSHFYQPTSHQPVSQHLAESDSSNESGDNTDKGLGATESALTKPILTEQDVNDRIARQRQYRQYIASAKLAGSLEAAMIAINFEAQAFDENNIDRLDYLLSQLAELAGRGLASAQAMYAASLIDMSEPGTAMREQAKVWLHSAALQHYPYAYFLLGEAYQQGHFGEKDMLKAYRYYYAAAIDHYSPAQLQIGYFNDAGLAVQQDKHKALSWYLLCVRELNLACIRNVGVYYRDGVVVEQDYQQALDFFKIAASRGHAQSMTSIGWLYLFGKGVEKDPTKAAELFFQSCIKEEGEACMHLGNLYLHGEGVDKNLVQANEYFSKSCQVGNSKGCNNLANSYEKGRGLDKSYLKASELYLQACDSGNGVSCSNLAFLYQNGNGVEKNVDEAQRLFGQACRAGVTSSCGKQ